MTERVCTFGGQQQQLAIARALVSHPKVLLLDEPTEGIQPNIVDKIADILIMVRKDMKIPIIIVEQNLQFAKKIASKYLIIQKGGIVSNGDMSSLTDEIIRQYLTV